MHMRNLFTLSPIVLFAAACTQGEPIPDPQVSGLQGSAAALEAAGTQAKIDAEEEAKDELEQQDSFADLPAGLRDDSSPLFVTNGVVSALHRDGDILYVGGEFTAAGPRSGPFAAINPATGAWDSTYPEALRGAVFAIEPDGAGGLYVGGTFDSMERQGQRALVHVLTNRTVDPAFHVEIPEGSVTELARGPSVLYVAGTFETINGVARRGLAQLDARTGALRPFDAALERAGTVTALAAVGTQVYVGGDFFRIGGSNAPGLVSLQASTGALRKHLRTVPRLDARSEHVSTLRVSDTGVLVVAGGFRGLLGSAQAALAFVDPRSNTLLPQQPHLDTEVYDLALQGTSVYLADARTVEYYYTDGSEDSDVQMDIALVPQTLRSIDLTSGAERWSRRIQGISERFDNEFPPNIRDLRLGVAEGALLLTGSLNQLGALRGPAATNVSDNGAIDVTDGNVALQPESGAPATSWKRRILQWVETIAGDGHQLFLGGWFNSINMRPRAGLAAIDLGSGRLTPWHPRLPEACRWSFRAEGACESGFGYRYISCKPPRVDDIASADGKVYVAGEFGGYRPDIPADDTRAVGLRAFSSATGRRDWSFKSPLVWAYQCRQTYDCSCADKDWFPSRARRIVIHGDRLMVAGDLHIELPIAWPRTTEAHKLLALDRATGKSIAMPEPDGAISDLALSGEQLYLVGAFNAVGGASRPGAAAIDLTTDSLTQWSPVATRAGSLVAPSCLAAGPTGIFLGGAFDAVSGSPRAALALVDGVEGHTLPYSAGLAGPALATMGVTRVRWLGGALGLAGAFTSVAGATAPGVAVLDGQSAAPVRWTPALDPAFEPLSFKFGRSTVRAMVDDGVGGLLVGGAFSYVADEQQMYLARFASCKE